MRALRVDGLAREEEHPANGCPNKPQGDNGQKCVQHRKGIDDHLLGPENIGKNPDTHGQ